jgi:hypothetical protein
MALFEHAAMSELDLLSGLNRTSRLRPPTSEFDPKATLHPFNQPRALAMRFTSAVLVPAVGGSLCCSIRPALCRVAAMSLRPGARSKVLQSSASRAA